MANSAPARASEEYEHTAYPVRTFSGSCGADWSGQQTVAALDVLTGEGRGGATRLVWCCAARGLGVHRGSRNRTRGGAGGGGSGRDSRSTYHFERDVRVPHSTAASLRVPRRRWVRCFVDPGGVVGKSRRRVGMRTSVRASSVRVPMSSAERKREREGERSDGSKCSDRRPCPSVHRWPLYQHSTHDTLPTTQHSTHDRA